MSVTHDTAPLAQIVRERRDDITNSLQEYGFIQPRIFGSVAAGKETSLSDIDVLVTASRPVSLMQLGRAELALEDILGVSVDIVMDHAIREDLAHEILSSAVPL